MSGIDGFLARATAGPGDGSATSPYRLKKGATLEQISRLEARLGQSLDPLLRQLLERHDGQLAAGEPLFGSMWLSGCGEIAADWDVLTTLLRDGDFSERSVFPGMGVAAVWWSEAWIPFATNWGGDHICLDMDPAGGSVGQVISFRHDMPERRLLADDLGSWLDSCL